jgi:hypothetical protein
MKSVALIFLILAACPAPFAAATADASGGGWLPVRMDMTVTVDAAASRARLEGTMRLRLDIASSAGPTIAINMDDELFKLTAVRGPAGSTVTLGTGPEQAPKVRTGVVRLGRAAARGDEVELSFAAESVGRGFQFVVSPDVALASWVSTWYPFPAPMPGKDLTPELRGAPGTTRFVMPAGWHAVSNGKLVDRQESADRAVDVWQLDRPAARSFAAGKYTASTVAAGPRTVGVYLLAPKPIDPERHARLLARALEAQEARFGPYPYPTYAIVEVPETLVEWYASSEQGFIMAKSSAFEVAHGNLPLWGHEMAHGWWGNSVATTGPGASWVSEALAQYGAVVAIEAIEGPQATAEFLEYSREGYNPKQCALGYFAMARDGKDMPISAMERKNPWEHNLVDAKGHWVYHMLRHRVGDEVFFATMRAIARDFAGRELSVAALREAFQKAAPKAGLDRFFAEWLDRAGAPVVGVDWHALDAGKGASITLEQRQPGEPYTLALEVAIDLKGGETKLVTLDLAERRRTFEIETAARPLAVRLDPNRRALVWRPEYGPAPAAR